MRRFLGSEGQVGAAIPSHKDRLVNLLDVLELRQDANYALARLMRGRCPDGVLLRLR